MWRDRPSILDAGVQPDGREPNGSPLGTYLSVIMVLFAYGPFSRLAVCHFDHLAEPVRVVAKKPQVEVDSVGLVFVA